MKAEYDDDDVFVLADAYDMVVVGTATDLLKKYNKIKSEGFCIVAGCETICPCPIMCYENAASNHSYVGLHSNRYVNAGLVIGNKLNLLKYMNRVLSMII